MRKKLAWVAGVFLLLPMAAFAETVTLDFWTGQIEGESLLMTYAVQVPVVEEREVSYTVLVPYVEEIKLDDGTTKQVTKNRPEERVRSVKVTRLVTEHRTRAMPAATLEEREFRNLAGELVRGMKLKAMFAEQAVVVKVGRLSEITPAMRLLLKENILVEIVKAPEEPRPSR